MKKLILVAFICMVSVLKGYAQDKKVAVVTFYTDKIIDFKELGLGSEALITEVAGLRDNPDFDLTPVLEKFHKEFFTSYAEKLPFALLDEETVTGNQGYKDFEPKWEKSEEELKRYVVADGYKFIYEGVLGKENEEGIANVFSDVADGVLFIEIHFAFDKGFGIGGTSSLKMKAFARMALYDKNGKKVVVINESANSKKTSVMVGGIPVMKPEKILPMCESAVDQLMKDLNKRIKKITKNVAKKL